MTRRFAGTAHSAFAVAVACALALSAGPAHAARWDTWNNANSLNSVTATHGIVWTASDLGPHRFDPVARTFTRIAKNEDQLAANAVSEVEVDSEGNTWFATKGAGVSVLRANGTWRTLTRFDGLPSDSVQCLELSTIGMWVGTRAGVALFDGFELVAAWPDGINPSPFASNVILDIAHVGDSTWVATPRGAYVTKTDEGVTWLRRVAGLGAGNVRSLTALGTEAWAVADGSVWRGGETGTWIAATEGLTGVEAVSVRARGDSLLLGTSGGVFLRTVANPTWQPLGAGVPGRAWVDFDDDGGIWAGNVEGLWEWNGTAWARLEIPGPGGNNVVNIALEGSEPWISTRDRGISHFDGTSWRTYSPSGSTAIPDTTLYSPADVFMMFVDSRGLKWAGNWGFAISTLDDSGPVPDFTHYFDPAQGGFNAMNTFGWSSAEDPSGRVWIGLDTNNAGQLPLPLGLHRFELDGSHQTFNAASGAAMSSAERVRAVAFAPGPSFEMWVGYATTGVDIFTDPTLQTRSGRLSQANNALTNDDTWGIVFNGDSVWVGNSSGLNLFSRADRQRKLVIATSAPTSSGAVHPLDVDASGGIWWATTSGLYHRSPDRTVEVFTAANSPILSDIIRAVRVDRVTGDVWIGTDRGVNRYSPGATSGPGPGVTTFTTYPNPVYMSAAGFRIQGVGLTGRFEGRVYDVRGRLVRSLEDNADRGLWDGTDEEGRRVAAGLYFIAVTQNGTTRTGRVLMVR